MIPASLEELRATKIIPGGTAGEVEKVRGDVRGKLVFTNGVFDLLHPGHLQYLIRARALGDCLWVGVNSDDSVRRLKGATRPVHPLASRLDMLAGLFCVDYLSEFEQDTPEALLERLHPDIHVKGGDYTADDLPETPLVRSFGGQVKILPFLDGHSSTTIIEKIQES